MSVSLKYKSAAICMSLCLFIGASKSSLFSCFAIENESEISLSAKSAVLIEQSTGQIIYEKDTQEKWAPASITKTMTMLLTIEAIERGDFTLDDMVKASENACSMGGTEIWLESGEEMSIRDLLKATAVSSANDAATALAEFVGGDEKTFVDMMNNRAKELGCKNTVFKNPHGLDEDGHFSCAEDIAIISAELMRHDLTQEFTTIWMDSLRDGATQLVNTNKLIRFYDGATGVKTGTTDNAGYCISASAQNNGLSLIAVVLGCPDDDSRFADAKALLNYGFQNYSFSDIPQIEEPIPSITVKYGRCESVEAIPSAPDGVLINNKLKGTLTADYEITPELTAPVSESQNVGTVFIRSDDEVICTYPLITKQEVEKMTVIYALKMFLKSVISL